MQAVQNLTQSLISDSLFGVELNFTRVFQQYQHEYPAIREAHCLASQFPAIFLPIRGDDWFAGRIRYRAVGFTPQAQILGGVGYYCDEAEIRRQMASASLTSSELDEVEAMLEFWRGEATYPKIRRAFPAELAAALPSDQWLEDGYVAFPLYRMAGANLDYDTLLKNGISGMAKLVRTYRQTAQRAQHDTDFYDALLIALDILSRSALFLAEQAQTMALRTADQQQRARFTQMRESLICITQRAPATLHEAIQLVYLYTMHNTLQSNYGRMDVYLGDFYVHDLEAGRLSRDEAIDMLLAFYRVMPSYDEFIESCARFDTRVFVGGKGRRNEAHADEFALLAMDASERFRGLYPQLSLRFYRGMDPRLYDRALDLLGEGLTFPILYNDDVNVAAVSHAFDVDERLAEQYVPFGCGEYTIAHTSIGTPNAIINLAKALEVTLFNGCDTRTGQRLGLALGSLVVFPDFEALYAAYRQQVEYFTTAAADFQALEYRIVGEEAAFLFMSLLYDDCLPRGQGMFSGGVRHLGGTYETFGNITVADSLTAIRLRVYQERALTPKTLLDALQADFAGFERERDLLLSSPKFGNDEDTADDTARAVHEHVCHAARNQRDRTGLDSYLVVNINNLAHVSLGKHVAASADGRGAGEPLTNGNTPSNGMDQNGITALLNSMIKLDPAIHAGATQNLKFSRTLFMTHRPQLQALLRTYFDGGGAQAMITVVNRLDLLNALREPEKYSNLIVRVGGFSARFIDLPPDLQREIISRTLWE
jgi:pyruvate-formate lyase